MKRLFIASIFLFTGAMPVFSQHVADSLRTRLKTDKDDTNKVNDLNNLAWEYNMQGRADTAIKLSNQANTMAQQLRFTKGILASYNGLGVIYYNTGDYAHALEYYTNGMKLAEQNGDKVHMAKFMGRIGTVYSDQGDYDKALENYFKALKTVQDLGDKAATANITGDIGNVYEYEGDYPKALEYNFKALAIDNELKDKGRIAIVTSNIGNVYADKKDYDRALESYQNALKMDEDLGDKNAVAVNTGNIGNIYAMQNKMDDALPYFMKAIKQNEEIGNKNGVAINTGNIGNIYSEKKQYDTAAKYFFKALDAYRVVGNKQGIAATYDNIGTLYVQEKKYPDAETYLKKSISLADSLHYLPCLQEDYESLSKLYSQTGQWPKAYDASTKSNAIKDSLFSQDKSQEIGRLEAKAEYDKQLAVQKAQEEDNVKVANEKTRRQRILILLVSAVALIVSLIALLIFRSLQNTRREKKLVEQQKSIMELKALRAQMNPHFIFNAITSIQNFILTNDTEATQKHLSKFSKLIRKVLENSKYESISLSEELQMLSLYIELEQLRFSSKFTFTVDVDKVLDAESVMIAPLILQPFVENAIWHGLMHLKNRQGILSIRVSREGNALKCIIDDNGIGRKAAMEIRANKSHQSMGLSITEERLHAANMSVNYIDKTEPDGTPAGTTVELTIPIITKK